MASDNFNRANESPLASPWASDSSVGGMNLVSNAATAPTGSDASSRYSSSSATESTTTLASGSDGRGGPAIHLDGSGNGYCSTGAYFGVLSSVVRLDAGAHSFIGPTGDAYGAGDVVRIRRSGSDVILSVNGVDTLTVTDTTHTGGAPGMFVFDSTCIIDDWTDGAGGGPSAPELTDVDSDETFASNATGVTFTGTNLGADETERDVYLVQGAVEVEQTQGSGNATGGTFNVVGFGLGGLLKYGTATSLKVETAEGEDSLSVTINPQSGYAYVDLTSVHSEPTERITAVDDLEIGDQLEYETVGGDVEVFDDATFAMDPSVEEFDVRAFDGEWGAFAAQGNLAGAEEGDFTASGSFGAGISGSAAASGSMATPCGLGAAFAAKASVSVAITAGLGAGASDASGAAALGSMAIPLELHLAAAAIRRAASAIAQGQELGESWAASAAAAAHLAVAGQLGAAFSASSTGSEEGALSADTAAGASFLAAAQAFAQFVPGATVGDVFVAIAQARGSVSAISSMSITAAALVAAQVAIESGLDLGESWAASASAAADMASAGEFGISFLAETQSAQSGAFAAGTAAAALFLASASALSAITGAAAFGLALQAVATADAQIEFGAIFGAGFSDGDLPPVPQVPPSRLIRIQPRSRTIRVH